MYPCILRHPRKVHNITNYFAVQLEELRADIVDLKEMYREQVNLLVNKVLSASFAQEILIFFHSSCKFMFAFTSICYTDSDAELINGCRLIISKCLHRIFLIHESVTSILKLANLLQIHSFQCL